MYLLIHRLIKI